MPRFVILEHDHPVVHWDLMLEAGEALRTWRLAAPPGKAAITSATGQIGFLQQLTDNKAVLRQAVDRLRARPYSIRDGERPAMTEYQALRIEDNDPGVLGFFVDELVKQVPGIANPEEWIKSRARRILEQAAFITTNTLVPLETLITSSGELPGRKLVFFVSDGFFLDQRREAFDRLKRLTNEAARSAVVIYTIDWLRV